MPVGFVIGSIVLWSVFIGALLILALGIIWAPFAAVISAWQSYRRGSEIWWYYGLIGAIYSLCFLFPWFYLAIRLAGRGVPIKIIVTAYSIIYMFWLVGLSVAFFLTTGTFSTPSPIFLLAFYINGAVAILSVVGLLWSLQHRISQERQQSSGRYYRHTVRDFAYLTPFVFTAALPLLFRWAV